MAIQMRRGLRRDFDPSRMVAGEWAVSIDEETENQIVWMCFAPNVVKRIGTYEDFEEFCRDFKDEMSDLKDSAEASAITAGEKAGEASINATEAGNSATQAETSATNASNSAVSSSNSSVLAQSWAVGGTGTREGEDADNAKYYAEQAKAVSKVDIATTEKAGIVKPDGTTISVAGDGTITAIGGGVSDYTELSNKPSINGQELNGNVSLSQIGAQPSGDYVTSSAKATATTLGLVKVDGTTTTVDADGTIHSAGGSGGGNVWEGSTEELEQQASTIPDETIILTNDDYDGNICQTVEECVASDNPSDVAGASAISEISGNLAQLGSGIVYRDYDINLSVASKSYGIKEVSIPSGYMMIGVDTLANSLAFFVQVQMADVNRVTIYNAHTASLTLGKIRIFMAKAKTV